MMEGDLSGSEGPHEEGSGAAAASPWFVAEWLGVAGRPCLRRHLKLLADRLLVRKNSVGCCLFAPALGTGD